ncbi:prokaryotic E2 ligase family D protein [Oscillochloris sp. ZM17-4]|uniref:prokaryotic E2 ligase family D protein n=1 Tax=Oscillochloris sp. ZM17-4 TaxID=2866714 RepID=UPI001C72C32A|nr:prokaryotic E2 ligase family D protein [Oscillochloris sp. ZM17-4]MBX0330034.1 prokaryotic E2 ligase family D protein [Oscillochloris sp. ZM17-4]
MQPKKKPQLRITKPPRWKRRESLIADVEPMLTLRFYRGGAVVAARRIGRRWSEYFVDAGAVRQVLAGTPTSTGLLDPHTLAIGMRGGLAFTVALIPPRKVKVATKGSEARDWAFTTPPIVWAGWGERYRIYALHSRDLARGWPRSGDAMLYHAPFANTYQSGSICWGSGRRPGPAEVGTMEAGFRIYAEDSFFIERATSTPSRQFGGDLIKLYASLTGRRAYPCDDLVPQGKRLSAVIRGEVFGDSE